jgi:O-antigen/teichoic acid export membrane protein
MRVRPAISSAAFRRICSSGLPQYVTNYLLAIAANADRTLLLALANGTHLVGMYAPALAVTSLMTSIPGSLTVYVYPRVLHRFGQTGEGRDAWYSIRRLVAVNLVVLGLLGIAGVLLSPWVVRRFFPAYEEGVLAMQIVAGTCVFHGLKAHTIVFATLKAWGAYVFYAVVAIVASYGCVMIGVSVFEPLTGAAAGMAAGVAAGGLCLLFTAKAALRQHVHARASSP